MSDRPIMEEEDTSESSPFNDELVSNPFPKYVQQSNTIFKNSQTRSQVCPTKPKTQQGNYQGAKKQTFVLTKMNTNQKKYNLWNTEEQKKVIGIIVDSEDFVNDSLVDMHLLLHDLGFFPNKQITVPQATKIKNIFKKNFADPRIKKNYSQKFLSEVTRDVIQTLRSKYHPKGNHQIQTTINPIKKPILVKNPNMIQNKNTKIYQQTFDQTPTPKNTIKNKKTNKKLKMLTKKIII
ncbi:hypothetical protein M0812_22715 [Anaeramoeba flamelloides]|uniref:Uncharacterized protein n=1 Tax=Anaeramoeba flamelloides TaxID=1746091 RepID=A0AAV7Z2B2_9EUKA|nr:hypothetical protein M0812_22715 [Anaeramoeba flamelloides]